MSMRRVGDVGPLVFSKKVTSADKIVPLVVQAVCK